MARERDIRHPDDAVMAYPSSSSAEYVREGVDELSGLLDPAIIFERTGVTHLVHCWFAQGRSVSPFFRIHFLYLSKESFRKIL